MKDEWCIVLDFLIHGHPGQSRSVPVAQVLGEEHFNLLEIIPREEVVLKSQDRVYIGAGKREQVKSIVGRIEPVKLTATAHSELKFAIELLIDKNEKKIMDFFNNAGSVTTKQHQLELLPSIGKKHMWQILDERKRMPFENFDDLKKRVTLLPDPKKAVVKRIMDELEGLEKWYLFVSPPRRDDM